MADFNDNDVALGRARVKPWRVAVYSLIYLALIFLLAILQTSNVRIFGQIPDMLLALICAIGFISGAGYGAVLGMIAGIAVELLSSTGFTLTPIVYLICGYLCGELINRFLSPNFLSFIVFGALAGIVREMFTLIYYGLISERISLWNLIGDVIVGEYFAYILCLIPAYFTVLTVHLLFKGKDDKSR